MSTTRYGNVASAGACGSCGRTRPPNVSDLGARIGTAMQSADGSRTLDEQQEEEDTAFLEMLCQREELALDNLRA